MIPSESLVSEQKTYTDIHVHGVPSTGMANVSGWRRHLFELFARQTGAQGTGPGAVRPYMDALIRNLHCSRYVRRAVLLALDKVYDAQGTPHQEGKTYFAVSNEEVLGWCRM